MWSVEIRNLIEVTSGQFRSLVCSMINLTKETGESIRLTGPTGGSSWSGFMAIAMTHSVSISNSCMISASNQTQAAAAFSVKHLHAGHVGAQDADRLFHEPFIKASPIIALD